VVPHNPYLSRRFNCHINVEVCASIISVKYLYKYVYKGHDRAFMAVERESEDRQPRDEPKEYLDARYISACEAFWRLFQFKMHDHSPAIVRLQLHLPDEQRVCFDPMEDSIEAVLARGVGKTTLTEWFTACSSAKRAVAELARTVCYPDAPGPFVWQ